MGPWVVYLILIGLVVSCGQESIGECKDDGTPSGCIEKSEDEKAMIALNAGDVATAQAILEKLIAEQPTEYFRYPRLASIYAEQGGFDLLQAATIQTGGGDIVESISLILPDPKISEDAEYDGYIGKLQQAKELLLAIPDDKRAMNAEFYSNAAQIQLTLYSSALSVMVLNKFTPPTPDQTANVEDLTAEDAVLIIGSLRDAAKSSETTNPEVSSQINQVLSQIDSFEGETDEEKLAAFIASRNQT